MLLQPLFRRRFRMVVSCLLVVLGATAAVHAIRATLAQRLYLETKYGFFRDLKREKLPVQNSEDAADRAYRAYKLYPENYYFPTYAAKLALTDAMLATHSAAFNEHLSRADYLIRLAVAINPYEAESRMLNATIMAEDGRLQEAIAYWRDEVLEHEYWSPDNHNFMAQLYLRSLRTQDMKAAVGELPLVNDREIREELRKLQKEMGLKRSGTERL